VPEAALQHLAERLTAGSVAGPTGVELAEAAFAVKLNLRGNVGDEAFRRGVQSALGLEPAVQANTFTRKEEVRCLWLGPDEWLIVATPASAGDLAGRLRAALAGQHVSVVDVAAAYTVLRMAGERSREVLSKACSLDLHPRSFRPGDCAQSNFARTQAIVALEDETPVFHLFVRRSLAQYLAEWLLDAMREYHVGERRDNAGRAG
jgi:sarcosine oxidase subunit gamma